MAISDGLADRITVPLGVFGLSVDPVSAGDSGDYLCLVNNRRRPNAVVRLLVQGKPTLWRLGHGPQIASSRERRLGGRATKVFSSRMAMRRRQRKPSMDYTGENFGWAINNRRFQRGSFLYEPHPHSTFKPRSLLARLAAHHNYTFFSFSPSLSLPCLRFTLRLLPPPPQEAPRKHSVIYILKLSGRRRRRRDAARAVCVWAA